MADSRREIARLCENLSWLCGTARAAGLDARLAAAVAAAAEGRSEGLTALLRRLDVPETSPTRDPGGIRYPPSTVDRQLVDTYECPAGACDREWIRPPGVAVPRCAVRELPLRRRPAP